MSDQEIKAIAAINDALSTITDPDTRFRILKWANEKFGYQTKSLPDANLDPLSTERSQQIKITKNELPGIAKITANGEFHLTVRDVKASSAKDAAIRLTHIVIKAYSLLTDQQGVSSKKIVIPILRNWRVYDGNTRHALANHKGILRNGGELLLDVHAAKEADRYIKDVLDPKIEGTWQAGSKARAKSKSSK
jgi:hypothetical protein